MTHKSLPKDLVFVAAKRTPFGTFGKSLKDVSAIDLGVIASKAAMEQAGVSPADIDNVIFGNVVQSSKDAIYMARHIGLKAGVPRDVPGLTVNRLCGSGFQAVISGALEILAGQATTVLCGGTENMSQVPHHIYGARWGLRLGRSEMVDYLWEALTDPYIDMAMSGTAEKLAVQYEVSREDSDELAALSHQRAEAATNNGVFAAEMTPVTIKHRKGDIVVDKDEHFRPGTTAEGLAKLRPIFGGVITAANASGINDGAGALILTTRDNAEAKGWAPLARLVSWGVVGCDPTIMGIGPVGAIKNALSMADLKLDQMDLVEVNEAFAPQYIACERALGLNREITNVNGGGIALGHPLAATGARITAHLIHELRRREAKLGIGSACIGGGQGIAVVVEAM
jgi:acetyl-CoA acetyltransferase family protein